MNNENQGKQRVPAEWKQVSQHKDDESGALVVIKKSDHRHRPAVEFSVGSVHGKTGLFTPHNLVKYDNEKPFTPEAFEKYVDGLVRIKAAVMSSLQETVTGIQKTLPKQRPNNPHSRKPGEPGKTGKTARKKAAKMGGAPKPAAQPGA